MYKMRNWLYFLILFAFHPIIFFTSEGFCVDECQNAFFETSDNAEIETGILYDKVIPFSKIELLAYYALLIVINSHRRVYNWTSISLMILILNY